MPLGVCVVCEREREPHTEAGTHTHTDGQSGVLMLGKLVEKAEGAVGVEGTRDTNTYVVPVLWFIYVSMLADCRLLPQSFKAWLN